MQKRIVSKPFVKWAGGKGRLLDSLDRFFPKEFSSYYEPFLGGGSVFFHLKPKKAFLNDINKILIETYKTIQKNPDQLISDLTQLEEIFVAKKDLDRKNFYLSIRKRFNELLTKDFEKIVDFIFLNRTCFNGLYRENSKGFFNVPFGDYKNPKICDSVILLEDSRVLKNVQFSSSSFLEAVSSAKKGDFIYFDPPYYPLNKASFTSYSEGNFGESDHLSLYQCFVDLDKKGCKIMMSNSDVPFIRNLYKNFYLETVFAHRSINSKGGDRGKIKELVIRNYR